MKQFILVVLGLVIVLGRSAQAEQGLDEKSVHSLVESACVAQEMAFEMIGYRGGAYSCTKLDSSLVGSVAFDIADSLAATSADLLQYRVKYRDSLTMESKSQMEQLEIELDKLVAKLRGRGI